MACKYDFRSHIAIIKNLILCILLLFLADCSLVTIEGGVEPIPQGQINARILTHEYGEHYVDVVEQTADTIASQNPNLILELHTIRWKLETHRGMRAAVFQTNPVGGLVDTWILTRQIADFFVAGPGQDLFGEWQPLANQTSLDLRDEMRDLAQSVTSRENFEKLRVFVESYSDTVRFQQFSFTRPSPLRSFRQYLGIPDSVAVTTLGTLPQVMTDFSSRMASMGKSIPMTLRWQTELLVKENRLDSLDVQQRLDSLAVMIDRIADIAERSPELLAQSMKSLRTELIPLLEIIDQQRLETLAALSVEREILSQGFQREREIVMARVDTLSQVLLDQAMVHLRKTINNILFWGLLILIAMFGIPFALGFLTGKALKRKPG